MKISFHSFFRPFIFAFIIILLIVSMLLTIKSNEKYRSLMFDRIIERISANATRYIELNSMRLSKKDQLFMDYEVFKDINNMTAYDITNKPLYDAQIIYHSADKNTYHMKVNSKILATLIRKKINDNGRYYQISIYSIINKKWFNLQLQNIQYPPIYLISLAIEFILFAVLLAYMISTQAFVKPWVRIRKLAKRLDLPLAEKQIPIFGPSIAQGAAKSMNQMIDHIDKLVQEKSNTLAAISHDVRTPLTKAKLYLQTKLTKPNDHLILEKNLDEIEKILSQITSFAKGGQINEKFVKLDLVSFVEAIVVDLIEENKPIVFEENINQYFISTQPVALKRVINNLIENAIKYGDIAQLSIIGRRKKIILLIKDHGPGIPEEEQARVFEPFYRMDTSRSSKVSGSGLGLSITKNILKTQGAQILIRNRLDNSGLQVEVIWRK